MKRTVAKNLVFLFGAAILLPGCVSIPVYKSTVAFENPYAYLRIIESEPTKDERAGVLLRIHPSSTDAHRYHEDNTLFARIKDTKGLKFNFTMERLDTYREGSREDSYVVHSKTTFDRKGGKLESEIELSSRGEIVRFIRGLHRSQIGKFEIAEWTRTPLFPEERVTIGDSWNYEEVMDVQMKSFWVKDIKPEPYAIHARSTLRGFALVDTVRCAVIETQVNQQKEQHLKTLFQTLRFTIHTHITETTYLDCATGTIVAQIAMTDSYTESPHPFLNDVGKGQHIVYLVSDDE